MVEEARYHTDIPDQLPAAQVRLRRALPRYLPVCNESEDEIMREKTVIALIYDYDKTLCAGDFPDHDLLPWLSIKPKEFWGAVTDFSARNQCDPITAYMYLLLDEAKKAGLPILREDLVELGKTRVLFPGLEDWFGKINRFTEEFDAEVRHYILSAGQKEIIEGASISCHMRKIYGSEFHYGEDGAADWPLRTINPMSKTQFLHHIRKDIRDMSEIGELCEVIPKEGPPVPFRNMIYFGDGITDIPCMREVRSGGGYSIAVYDEAVRGDREFAAGLLEEEHADFIAQADYTEDSELYDLVCDILAQQISKDRLEQYALEQRGAIVR
jgi:hypothetical protein